MVQLYIKGGGESFLTLRGSMIDLVDGLRGSQRRTIIIVDDFLFLYLYNNKCKIQNFNVYVTLI